MSNKLELFMFSNISYISYILSFLQNLYEPNQIESNSKLAKENCDPIMHGIHSRSGLQCQKGFEPGKRLMWESQV